ncbi:hypothetical protein MCETHM1_00801 [Flavobacteriaceae bacterium]
MIYYYKFSYKILKFAMKVSWYSGNYKITKSVPL